MFRAERKAGETTGNGYVGVLGIMVCVLLLSGVASAEAVADEETAADRELRARLALLERQVARQEKEIAKLRIEAAKVPKLEARIKSQAEELATFRPAKVEESKIAPIRLGGTKKGNPPVQHRPAIGIVVMPIDKSLKRAILSDGLAAWKRKGVMVVSVVNGGPADKAGVKKLDIIITSNRKSIKDVPSFIESIRTSQVGKPMQMTIYRMGPVRRGQTVRPWVRRIIRITPVVRRVVVDATKECPLSLKAAKVKFNSIGRPEAHLSVQNDGVQSVDAYTVDIQCYDRFDKPVNYYGRSNRHIAPGISQTSINPGEVGESSWGLSGRSTTAKIKIVLTKVRMEDGTEWTPKKEEAEVSVVGVSSR